VTRSLPSVSAVTPRDLIDVLAKGVGDFRAMPTHIIFLGFIYPVVALVIAWATFKNDLLPLLYAMVTGFALIGPFAAIGIYGLSRRREEGLDAAWNHAFDLPGVQSFRAILALGFCLLAIFVVWIVAAQSIYVACFSDGSPESIGSLVQRVLTTEAGRRMILIGNFVGFLFAVATFAISVLSFPLLIDRNVSAIAAVSISIRSVLRNPLTMAMWGLIVAGVLLIGSLPLFVGLAVAIPVLGHSTWHLYRKVVVPELPQREQQLHEPKGRRYAPDLPAVLLPVYGQEPGSITSLHRPPMVVSEPQLPPAARHPSIPVWMRRPDEAKESSARGRG
jgi:uncharacterized membrane protein